MPTRRELLAALSLPLARLSPLLAQARESDSLKIASVEPFVLRIGARKDIVCARVRTTEGLHGWGEGTTPPTIAPVVATIRSFEPLLKGESAWNIEKLWRRMYI